MQESNAIEAWLQWYSECSLITFDIEFLVKGRMAAGTCDWLGELTYPAKKIFNKVYYLDWKSSLFVDRPSHGTQIATYKVMDGRYPKAGIGVLYLDKDLKKDPPYQFIDYTPYFKRYRKQFNFWRAAFYNVRPQLKAKAKGE